MRFVHLVSDKQDNLLEGDFNFIFI